MNANYISLEWLIIDAQERLDAAYIRCASCERYICAWDVERARNGRWCCASCIIDYNHDNPPDTEYKEPW